MRDMEERMTREEKVERLKKARLLLRDILEASNQETGVEVVVVLRVVDELDLTTSAHCCECAVQLLEEGRRMLMEDMASELGARVSSQGN